mmetsp:Transcript_21851/g.63587  ORF Transcript_21851/g.63587 Transcript_21851/m.63587 type:complete len:217 (-) Transcript_21851:158-808(-)
MHRASPPDKSQAALATILPSPSTSSPGWRGAQVGFTMTEGAQQWFMDAVNPYTAAAAPTGPTPFSKRNWFLWKRRREVNTCFSCSWRASGESVAPVPWALADIATASSTMAAASSRTRRVPSSSEACPGVRRLKACESRCSDGFDRAAMFRSSKHRHRARCMLVTPVGVTSMGSSSNKTSPLDTARVTVRPLPWAPSTVCNAGWSRVVSRLWGMMV